MTLSRLGGLDPMPAPTVPDPGMLVEVRQRRFVVSDVVASELPVNPLRAAPRAPQHLVALSCVEDDATGEDLEVVWEIEPGARILERGALPEPTGFDDPRRLDAFLDAVRWGAVSRADVRTLQAPFRSGIDIEDYQLDPLVRAIQMPRVNLLIADDVGLGKTIEAGLVAQELILRHRAHRILIVCPASLQIQWRDQMRDKFGLDFRIVDGELFKQVRRERGLHVNPWTHFPRLITSLPFLRRDRRLRLFLETLPAADEPIYPRRYDLLILDEAHNVAPSGAGHIAIDSQQTEAIRRIAPHFEHKLFLTATPHNGYRESFTALLELLDGQRFARGIDPDREQLAAVMVRRMKSELKVKWDGTRRFPERDVQPIVVAWPEGERAAHRDLATYCGLRQQAVREDTGARYATEFVLKLLKKRMFSSPAALAVTLAAHERALQAARGGHEPLRTTLGVLRRHVEAIDEEHDDDERHEEATHEALEGATGLLRQASTEERALLRSLREFAAARSGRPDAKATALLRWLHDNVKPRGRWGTTRVIIFTEYRATQKWLLGLLAAEGLSEGDRLLTLYGGMCTEDRERIKAAFQADPAVAPVRILLATDAASEGIDLQNHCSHLIHYDIPWNPNRMEQRNGRIDRHGQNPNVSVRIFHFVGEGYGKRGGERPAAPGDLEGDYEFLYRAALKVETIREDLGKVGPVIAAQVEEAMLGRRHDFDTRQAESEAEPVRRMLRFERRLREQIEKQYEQLQETRRDLHLTPENIAAIVTIGLQLAGQPPLRSGEREGEFHLPALRGSWARCSEGLAHPHTGEIRPITFDPARSHGRDDVVLAHLNHRLVQMCLRLLRAEVWATGGRRLLHRVTARIVPDNALDTPAMVVHGRLVVLGADNHRLHEEVVAAGAWIREGRLARMNVGQTQAALAAGLSEAAPAPVRRKFALLWPQHRDGLIQALEARTKERTENLAKALDERAAKESDDVTKILRELERAIRTEIEAPQPAQLELWTSPEQEQLERNLDGLRARLKEIPDEILRETAAVRSRYARPTPRLFPIAVTYLVPRRLALEGEEAS